VHYTTAGEILWLGLVSFITLHCFVQVIKIDLFSLIEHDYIQRFNLESHSELKYLAPNTCNIILLFLLLVSIIQIHVVLYIFDKLQ
jgi:hypothetical protein